jgi:alkylation response protein AidB-like acyl-CoA dehydrogenase
MSAPTDLPTLLAAVDVIAREIVARDAIKIDRDGVFPSEAIAALGAAGVLGLISAPAVGGRGLGPAAAVEVVERIARECGSTAMVLCMHFSATALIEKLGPDDVRRDIAAGRHLTTLAFSEAGSRGQFWAPLSTAARDGDTVYLTARKSWVTSSHHADSYVWSSKPVATEDASTLWLVPSETSGLRVAERFDGLGLRGNDSCPITAERVAIPARAMLGADGAGFGLMLEVALPWFNVLSSAVAVGLMESATAAVTAHVVGARFEHSGQSVADLATVRAFIAQMRIKTDLGRCLTADTAAAMEGARADAVLRVLESKAATGELAAQVVDLGMRVAGGAAFRREVGVERMFRDARAGLVMAPTVDMLYEFVGRVVCQMPLF